MQKQSGSRQRTPLPSAGSERLLHAIALVIARRQMNALWTNGHSRVAPKVQLTPLSGC
jgi:hypothetical protein